MATTPVVPQVSPQSTTDALKNAQQLAQEILSNPLSSPADKAAAQAALEQITATTNSIQSMAGGVLDSPIANSILNGPTGDIIPPNDYTPGGGNPLGWTNSNSGVPDVSGVPNEVFSAMSEENSPLAKQFENSFVSGVTENIVDPDYTPSNDFDTDISPPAQSSSGGLQDGIWESLEYATDWNAHHGKFKFLFKIKFGGGPWQYYVKSATKPKIKMVHQDVNYYNFRSKVLTQVTFDPMTIVLWDEIGNSVNNFFATYLATVSGQGSGNWGVDSSFDSDRPSSSSKSYRNAGYGENVLATVIIEQVFANGTKSNRFIFKNARIESMDLDDLTMDTTEMNTLAITFNYDALECVTVDRSVIHTDPSASKDLLRGGGSGGPAFGANDDGRQFNPISIGGAASPNIPGFGNLLSSAESIFANALPSIGVGISAGPGGVNVNIAGGVPGIGANVNIGPNGVAVAGGVNVPGFSGNLVVGPGGVAGGIAGGVPGVGGALTFGPGGIAGTGGVTSGPVSLAGAFNPNGVSAMVGVAMTSPTVGIMAAPMPPIGSYVSEEDYINNIAIGENQAPNNLLVQPYNVP